MYKINLEKKTIDNKNYRKILHTTKQMQLVVMRLLSGEDIDRERHPSITQFIRVEKGIIQATVDDKKTILKDGDCCIIPAGHWHYIKNIGKHPAYLYTIYSPPEHEEHLVQRNKPIENS